MQMNFLETCISRPGAHIFAHSIFHPSHYHRQSQAATALNPPREIQATIDEVKQPASTQASLSCPSPSAFWEVDHIEDKKQLSWVLKARAAGMRPQRVLDRQRQGMGNSSMQHVCVCICVRDRET